jgi:hypothetical protein
MLSQTFGLLFYLKKRNNLSSGPDPVNLHITVDGKRAELSCKRSYPDPEKCISASGRMSGTKESVHILNAHLDTLQNQVFEVYKTLLQKEASISAAIIKPLLLGKNRKSQECC